MDFSVLDYEFFLNCPACQAAIGSTSISPTKNMRSRNILDIDSFPLPETGTPITMLSNPTATGLGASRPRANTAKPKVRGLCRKVANRDGCELSEGGNAVLVSAAPSSREYQQAAQGDSTPILYDKR